MLRDVQLCPPVSQTRHFCPSPGLPSRGARPPPPLTPTAEAALHCQSSQGARQHLELSSSWHSEWRKLELSVPTGADRATGRGAGDRCSHGTHLQDHRPPLRSRAISRISVGALHPQTLASKPWVGGAGVSACLLWQLASTGPGPCSWGGRRAKWLVAQPSMADGSAPSPSFSLPAGQRVHLPESQCPHLLNGNNEPLPLGVVVWIKFHYVWKYVGQSLVQGGVQ